jgi:hypothetical protein
MKVECNAVNDKVNICMRAPLVLMNVSEVAHKPSQQCNETIGLHYMHDSLVVVSIHSTVYVTRTSIGKTALAAACASALPYTSTHFSALLILF